MQHAPAADGRTVAGTVLDHLRGAQRRRRAARLVRRGRRRHDRGRPGRTSRINGPLLAPGYGAQGGTVADLRRIFGAGRRHGAAELVARAAPPRPRPGRAARRGAAHQRRARRAGRADARARGLVAVAGCWRCCRWPRGLRRPQGRATATAVKDHQQPSSPRSSRERPAGRADPGAAGLQATCSDKAPSRHPRRVAAASSARIEALQTRRSRTPGVDPASYDRTATRRPASTREDQRPRIDARRPASSASQETRAGRCSWRSTSEARDVLPRPRSTPVNRSRAATGRRPRC